MSNYFKGHCPNCGKEVLLMSHKDTRFCDRICESEFKARKINPRLPVSKEQNDK